MRDHWASFDLSTNQIVYAKNATDAQGGRALRFRRRATTGVRGSASHGAPSVFRVRFCAAATASTTSRNIPAAPILNAINPPPGGIAAPDAASSGFGFTRDFTAPALATNPAPTLFWDTFSRGSSVVPARVAVNAVDPHIRDTYVQQWNVTLQQRLGANVFEAGYVANKSNGIFTSEDLNLPGDFQSKYVLGTAALIRPGFSSITYRHADGAGQYHSLQAKYERRMRSAQILASYTWGHAISDAEQGQSAVGVGNPGTFHFLSNRKLDKSSTTFDVRQRFVSAVVYEVPFLRNGSSMLAKVAGGWQTNFIFTAQTGNATQVTDGTGRADSWSRFDRPGPCCRSEPFTRGADRESIFQYRCFPGGAGTQIRNSTQDDGEAARALESGLHGIEDVSHHRRDGNHISGRHV